MRVNLPKKPKFKSHFAVEVLEPDALFLLGEQGQQVFRGRLFVRIASLLDGKHTIPEILAKIGKSFPLHEFFISLHQLLQKGCIVEADGKSSLDYPAFWDYLGADPGNTAGRMEKASLAVETVGDIDSRVLVDCLERNGMTTSQKGELLLVATDDYLLSELEEINHGQMASGRPWILVKPVGMVLWIGPLFRPGETGCWKCLEQRLKANRQVERFARNRSEKTVSFDISKSRLPSSVAAGMNLAAMEIAKTLVIEKDNDLEGKVVTLDLVSLEYKEHILVKRPQCSACSSTITLEPKPVVLQSRPKIYSPISGHRTAIPEETFERYKHHISPITGVITSFQQRGDDIYGGRINNYSAGHYFPILTDDVTQLSVNLFTRSGGGGRSEIQAKVGALCESIERYSGIYWGEEKKMDATYNELRPEAVHIRDLALFSENQHKNREELNKTRLSDQQYIPDPLDDNARIAWSPAWSMTDQCFKFLPTGYCYYGHMDPGFSCVSDSNGNAAGNSIEEAILLGFLELVERDAVALWWYNRAKRPEVNVDSFGIPYLVEVKTLFRDKLHRDLHILDITTDLKIPAFAAVSRRIDRPTEDIITGFCAHLDPRTAIVRAVDGANQYMPALSRTSEDGSTLYRMSDPETIAWWKNATYGNQPYLTPDSQAEPKGINDYPSMASNDLMTDVMTCLDIVRENGLEMLVVDQTRPDIGLPVAKVVVPGLRHFWRRLAPGRLYNVPVALGWLDRPLLESEMNPIACFV